MNFELFLIILYRCIDISDNNKLLLKLNICIIVLLFCIILASYFVRYFICNEELNLWSIIIENILGLIVIGIIEYYFFINYASKYIPVLPSYLPTILNEKLTKKLNEK